MRQEGEGGGGILYGGKMGKKEKEKNAAIRCETT